MIAPLLIAGVAVATQPDARKQLTNELIQTAVRAAPKDSIDGLTTSAHRVYYHGSFVRDLGDKYLQMFESFPATQQFISAALPESQPHITLAQPGAFDPLESP
jgi:hypothetical protein